MRVRPLIVTAAVTTVATLVTGTAVTAATAFADTKVATNLSIREARQLILLGRSNVISGQLRARGIGAVANAPVQLLARTINAPDWTSAGIAKTNDRGVARLQRPPSEPTRH